MSRHLAIVFALTLSIASLFAAKPPRSPRPETLKSPHQIAKSEFEHAHPCPSSGASSGPCPGYVVGYITSLACGGPDLASNMVWQTPEQAKAAKKKPCAAPPGSAR